MADQEHSGVRESPPGEPADATGPVNGRPYEAHVQRAQELVDRMAERVGYYAGLVGHELLRLTARAGEEVEDMWAEAQAIRRAAGGRP